MSVDRSTLDALKHAYHEWNRTSGGSADVWLDLLADNVAFGSLADGAEEMKFTENRRSKEEVIGYFKGLAADWEMQHYHVENYIVDGDQVVARGDCHFVHRQTRCELKTPKADFLRFKDGKVVEFFEFYDTASAFKAARGES